MKERPILFSSPMVRAINDGRKTQTRRVVNVDLANGFDCPRGQADVDAGYPFVEIDGEHVSAIKLCPYGQPGDRLWVRETWQYYDFDEYGEPKIRYAADNATAWPNVSEDEYIDKIQDEWAKLSEQKNYEIDNHARDRRWRPSIQMPRWASRILLEITEVRVERLQEISEDNAQAEGVEAEIGRYRSLCAPVYGGAPWIDAPSYTKGFEKIWHSIHAAEGQNGWTTNPWVWVMTFKRIDNLVCTRPKDQKESIKR